MKRPLKLDGCWTAMTSPFTADGHAIDMERWQAQLAWQAKGGVRGVVPCGTTGEAPTLAFDEQRSLIARAVEVMHPLGVKVMGGHVCIKKTRVSNGCCQHVVECQGKR